MLPPDTCLCRSCGWVGLIRGFAICPECHGRYLRAVPSMTAAELLAIIIEVNK